MLDNQKLTQLSLSREILTGKGVCRFDCSRGHTEGRRIEKNGIQRNEGLKGKSSRSNEARGENRRRFPWNIVLGKAAKRGWKNRGQNEAEGSSVEREPTTKFIRRPRVATSPTVLRISGQKPRKVLAAINHRRCCRPKQQRGHELDPLPPEASPDNFARVARSVKVNLAASGFEKNYCFALGAASTHFRPGQELISQRQHVRVTSAKLRNINGGQRGRPPLLPLWVVITRTSFGRRSCLLYRLVLTASLARSIIYFTLVKRYFFFFF